MSGLAVGFGEENDPSFTKTMLKTIEHRGREEWGFYVCEKVSMAQNYLRADRGAGIEKDIKDKQEIPVFLEGQRNLRICYDGEIGNWAELAREHNVDDRPDRDERLLLRLYLTYGPQMSDL